MSYTDMRDFEAEHTHESPDGLTVKVEKLGGGTVGSAYTGTWRYIVSGADGAEIGRGQDYTSGMPHTHVEAAEGIADFFTEES